MKRTLAALAALVVTGVSGYLLGASTQASAQAQPKDHTRLHVPAPAPGAPPRPYTSGVVAGDILYLSGTVGNDPKTGVPPPVFGDAVKQAIANQTEVLKAANMTWGDVVKVNVYVKDMAKYGEFNKIYMESLGQPLPARTFIAVADLPANGQVEIEAVAIRRR
jgi:2-iminobutanoate/2-iminopropanoate deaminase